MGYVSRNVQLSELEMSVHRTLRDGQKVVATSLNVRCCFATSRNTG